MRTLYYCAYTLCLFLLFACSHSENVTNDQFAFLSKVGITVDDKLLLGDSLTLPDIYCGDPGQKTSNLKGIKIDQEQYDALIVPIGHNFPDIMSNWLLLGVRDMGNGVTLIAYYAASGTGYRVCLVTYDRQGHVLDAINAREMHLVWRINLSEPDNDDSYTLDALLTFDEDKVSLLRTMGRCVMDYDNDLKGAPLWQQQWQQTYTVNSKGHFVLDGQRVVSEQGQVDRYGVMDFKTWDMLVCSLYDPGIMDTWNDYVTTVEETYTLEYRYNPFPKDVEHLYKMNPTRFLKWMAAPANRNNRLMRYFKLMPNERPALLKEIAHLDDPAAFKWLTSVVNSWDDKPLTQHL